MGMKVTLIQSVSRALNLLDAVGDAGRPLPAKTLARAIGVPLPTAYHLLRTLVHEGYLRREPEGYVLGDRIDALTGGPGLRLAHAHTVLEHLRDELRCPAYLSVLDDGEIHLADVADSAALPRVDLWVGFHDASHATALGKAVLSTLPQDQRREYIETHELVDLTQHTVTDSRVLFHELDECVDFAFDHEEYAVGTACVAAPVPSQDFHAAVAVSVPVARLRWVCDHSDALRRAARLIAYAGDVGR